MKFINNWLGTFIINSEDDLQNLYSNFNDKVVESFLFQFVDDEKEECPDGYKYLFQLKFKGEEGFWTIGYSDINYINI